MTLAGWGSLSQVTEADYLTSHHSAPSSRAKKHQLWLSPTHSSQPNPNSGPPITSQDSISSLGTCEAALQGLQAATLSLETDQQLL